jgi:alkanesulfonate monooxygenase
MGDPVTTIPPDLRIFATIPPPAGGGSYRDQVHRAARLSEAAGFHGALVYSDNRTVDPWAVAQELLSATARLSPLVALQPLYMHPYAVAKRIASLGLLFDRRVCLNLVAGGNQTDLAALDDRTEHDARYRRLTEYTRLVARLLAGTGPVTVDGEHYRTQALDCYPALPGRLLPELYISGSSEAGRQAAEQLGAVPVRYPMPPADGADPDLGPPGGGVRIGVIARDTDAEAWRVATARFPDSRAGQMLQRLARRTSDSEWVARLSAADEFPGGPDSPYWMGPFRNYATFCPYLVGSHEKVTAEVARYVDAGCRTFILDTARDEGDYAAIGALFARVPDPRRRPPPRPVGAAPPPGAAPTATVERARGVTSMPKVICEQ